MSLRSTGRGLSSTAIARGFTCPAQLNQDQIASTRDDSTLAAHATALTTVPSGFTTTTTQRYGSQSFAAVASSFGPR